MAHPHQFTTTLGFACLLGLFSANDLSAVPPPAALMNTVALTAWLDAGEGRPQDIIVEVNLNGDHDWGRPDGNGRVDLVLPADAVALISFRKPGHLTKSLSVDTHHMQDGDFLGKHRSFSFGVKLEATSEMNGMAYAGPVGSIAFDDGGGCLLVERDRKLVPASHQQKVVF